MDKRYFIIFWNYNNDYSEFNNIFKDTLSKLINPDNELTIQENEFKNILLIETSNVKINEEILSNRCKKLFLINNGRYSGALGYLELYVKEVINHFQPIFPILED